MAMRCACPTRFCTGSKSVREYGTFNWPSRVQVVKPIDVGCYTFCDYVWTAKERSGLVVFVCPNSFTTEIYALSDIELSGVS